MKQEQKTIEEILDEFEAAKGKEFVFTGDGKTIKASLAGEILGVDRANLLVMGEHGEFPINICKIKEDQPPSLKAFQDRKKQYSQQSFF